MSQYPKPEAVREALFRGVQPVTLFDAGGAGVDPAAQGGAANPFYVRAGAASPVVVNSPIAVATASFTRPSDTNAYAASDVVCNSTSAPALLQFSNILPVAGGDGVILNARGFVQGTGFNTALRLHLYKVNTITPLNDNAAFTLLWANRANRVGFIDFTGWQTGGSGSDAAGCLVAPNLAIELDSGQTSLWGMVETRGVFTPTSAQQFFFSLKTVLS